MVTFIPSIYLYIVCLCSVNNTYRSIYTHNANVYLHLHTYILNAYKYMHTYTYMRSCLFGFYVLAKSTFISRRVSKCDSVHSWRLYSVAPLEDQVLIQLSHIILMLSC